MVRARRIGPIRGLGVGLAVLSALLIWGARIDAQDDAYVVIVHPDVAVDRLTMSELARLYQRRTTQWSDGTAVVPVEQAGPVRTRFYRDTMGMTVGEVGNFWVRQAMTSAIHPPRLLGSADLVVPYVAATPGAIAFVEASAHLGRRVKQITISD